MVFVQFHEELDVRHVHPLGENAPGQLKLGDDDRVRSAQVLLVGLGLGGGLPRGLPIIKAPLLVGAAFGSVYHAALSRRAAELRPPGLLGRGRRCCGRRGGALLREAVEGGGLLDSDAVVMVLAVAPGAQPPGPEVQEHTADQLAERGGVDGVQFAVSTVAEVKVIEGGSG